jgi:carbonic anhydrase
MGRPPRHLLLLLLSAAAVLLLLLPAARAQEETEDEHEFSYDPRDAHGPAHWGQIKAEWGNCSAGRMQSPIDLHHERVTLVRALGYLDHSYRPAQASIVNRGHDIMVRLVASSSSSSLISGTPAVITSLSIQWPAGL